MLEGIGSFVTRGDLRDRAITLALEPLSNRKTKRALQAEFKRVWPGVLGALLDLLVTGVRQLPSTHLTNPPRMADFTTWCVACGLDGFEAAYAANRQAAIDIALDHDALAHAMRALTAQQKWEGTATELLDTLGPAAGIKNAKALSDELSRLAPMLRSAGADVRHHRTGARRIITIQQRDDAQCQNRASPAPTTVG